MNKCKFLLAKLVYKARKYTHCTRYLLKHSLIKEEKSWKSCLSAIFTVNLWPISVVLKRFLATLKHFLRNRDSLASRYSISSSIPCTFQNHNSYMKSVYKLALLAAVVFPAALQAQPVVDRSKYPDYDPTVRPDRSLRRYGRALKVKGAVAPSVSQRPAYVNNAANMYFPPVFNQEGGSCGSASRIGYMFTYELNAYRGTDASKFENQYPTHFVWLLTNGNSGKDQFVQFVGVPSAKTYGGRMNSALFGYREETNNDFGWMTGYEKWFEAMHNRMYQPAHIPNDLGSEEGREQMKNWLWNHNGDTDFRAGGIAGIGVASAVTSERIPNTAANQAAGVVGQQYVKYWGVGVDHALTLVGYDDRIEFDLDGNGKYGEKEKDEVGAWIIANSWGLWANNGLIYCPYANAFPAHTQPDAKGVRHQSGGFWQPEIYHVRKDYRPFRTIKVKMDYSRRSELLLQVGVSANLDAKKPDAIIDLHHFRWAGDGRGGDIGTGEKDQKELPEMPMLGRWADGQLHTEPMEFGYDLTDLSAGFDRSRPLKYFFIINSKTKSGISSKAKGSGHLYDVSILDYEFDKEGVETPFVLEKKDGANSVDINKGTVATYSTIVYGEQFFAPTNAAVSDNKFTWSAPQANGHKIKEYKVFVNGMLRGTTKELSYPVTDAGSYAVKAVYEGGHETSMISAISSVARQEKNVAVDFKQAGFTIPDVFKDTYPECTIEFWMKPHSVTNWNQQGGPGWGSFMCHANADGTYTAGWDAAGNARANASGALRVNQWSHIAMVVQRSNFRILVDGKPQASAPASGGHSGIGGFGNLVFAAGDNGQDAIYDEIRIWNKARTNAELSGAHTKEFSGELMPQGLLAYYKGDIITIDGKPYLRDCVGGYHAPLTGSGYKQVDSDMKLGEPSGYSFTNTSISGARTIEAGQPLTLKANYQDHVKQLEWSAPDANVDKYAGAELTLVFPKEGKYKVTLTVKGEKDKTRTVTKEITVTAPAPCSADFVASLKEVPAGQRVSFNPVNPVAGYQYAWAMPGGSVVASNAVSAGTSYETPGKHEVTLTVTSSTGEVKTSKQAINVVNVAPEAAFSIQNPVVLKNEKGWMTSESKFRPSTLEWIFNSGKNVLVKQVALKDKKDNALPYEVKQPGVYDVTLKAGNEVGKSETTQKRGLIVVNADSKNGLSFNHLGASVELSQQPITKETNNFTIDWWMNPAKLSDFCCGIGDVDATFQIKADYRGRLQIHKNGRLVQTGEGVVKSGEWHHYAVSVSNGSNVKVYCDGELVGSSGNISGSQMPNLSRFTIGNESADMSGQIDEFRIWEKVLTPATIQKYANVPLEGELLNKAKSEDKLKVYYNFNQTSGNVVDQSGNGYEGVRKNFGPEGDAWALSRGVFSLNFDNTMEDVSSELKNNRAYFKHTNKKVNGSNSRWYELADWLVENTSKEGNITAGAHYDNAKGGAFTVTSGWDGFPNLKDHKVYQVLHLKAGAYALTTSFGQHGESANCFLVAALGNKLPDSNQLDQALSSTPLKPGNMGTENTLNFVLTEDTDVALGIVANMIGNKIFCIHNFKLVRNSVETITNIGGVKTNVQSSNAEGTFDLSGRRVEKTESGQIYIQNGQRVVAQ